MPNNKKSVMYYLFQTVGPYWKFIKDNPLLLPIILAFCIRLAIILSADFPLNDGGMFYTMVQDILKANFALPHFTTYNHADIPFAYPPLSFYIAAILNKFFSIPLIALFRFLPLTFSILTIPAFYLLSKELLGRKLGIISTFVFALLPRGFIWQIMGGGLARALGFTLALLTIYFGIKFYKRSTLNNFLPTTLFFTLTLLTHMEWVTFATYSLLILAFLLKNPWENIVNLFKLTFVSGILSLPWWLTLVLRHGLGPFFDVQYAGFSFHDKGIYFILATLSITDETFITIWASLTLLGILWALKKRAFWLLLWFLLPLLVISRSAPNLIVVPQAILIGVALSEIIIPAFKEKTSVLSTTSLLPLYTSYLYIFLYLISSLFALVYANNTYFRYVTKPERDIMMWIKENTELNDKFLLLTKMNMDYWGMDTISEWFPALSDRESVLTPQGYEWLPNNEFYNRMLTYSEIRDCYDKNLSCMEKVFGEKEIFFSYLYLYKPSSGETDYLPLIRSELINSMSYSIAYENESSIVFKRI